MLGINSTTKMQRPPCPLQTEQGPCGAETSLYDDRKTMVRCRKGHLTDVAQMPVRADEIAPPSLMAPKLSFNPKNAIAGSVLVALVIEAVLRHL